MAQARTKADAKPLGEVVLQAAVAFRLAVARPAEASFGMEVLRIADPRERERHMLQEEASRLEQGRKDTAPVEEGALAEGRVSGQLTSQEW